MVGGDHLRSPSIQTLSEEQSTIHQNHLYCLKSVYRSP
jgi:hypothetical protein